MDIVFIQTMALSLFDRKLYLEMLENAKVYENETKSFTKFSKIFKVNF